MLQDERNAAQRGYSTREELEKARVLPPLEKVEEKRVCIIECTEEIPCNPCVQACPFGAISKEGLCKPGVVDWDICVGCTQCIAKCPGMSLFLQRIEGGKGYVTLPYEFLPEPKMGGKVQLLDRSGKKVGEGRIVNPTYQAKGDAYPRWVVTVEMDDPELSYEVRAIRILE